MLSQKRINSYKSWFDQYVNQFIEQYPELSENLEIKADHCKKVSNEIVGIAKSLNLSGDILLAETIGLFHDVGRFKQYVKYQTFSDSKSQNHAELGVEVLKENEVLKDLQESTIEIIYKSILNHSRAEIIPDNNERVNFFSKLIRDADKLDIWRLITEYYMLKEQKENKTLVLDLLESEDISELVLDDFINKKLVLKETLKTVNDFKILQIAWLFDLNFAYSIKRLYDKKYLDKIFETLPTNDKIDQIKEIVNLYFSDWIKEMAS